MPPFKPRFERDTKKILSTVRYPENRYDGFFVKGWVGTHDDDNINILRAFEDIIGSLNNETSDGNFMQGINILLIEKKYDKEQIKTALTSETGKEYIKLNAHCLFKMMAKPQDVLPVMTTVVRTTGGKDSELCLQFFRNVDV